MTAHDPIAIALRVAAAIESVGGAYFIGGSVASSLQGDPRKLLWFREGGSVSDKQWRDIVAILRVSRAALDVGYMTAWAQRLGVATELTRAEGETGSSSS